MNDLEIIAPTAAEWGAQRATARERERRLLALAFALLASLPILALLF
jgi:hypothetical protein